MDKNLEKKLSGFFSELKKIIELASKPIHNEKNLLNQLNYDLIPSRPNQKCIYITLGDNLISYEFNKN